MPVHPAGHAAPQKKVLLGLPALCLLT